MLKSLYVRDYALIEELRVEFDAGLTIITGETGAGKSILIGALQAILGERTSPSAIRSGAAKAVIEGVFDQADDPSVASLLPEYAVDPAPVMILRREITASYSRGFINDSPATLQAMRAVASRLIDLHGQHEHQSLLNVSTHIGLLDDFGRLGEAREAYADHFRNFSALLAERDALAARQRDMEEKRALHAFQIDEIDHVSPGEGEEELLENERRVLEHAERLHEASARLSSILYEGGQSIHDQLIAVRNELRELAEIDPRFEETLGEIDSACIVTAETSSFLKQYGEQAAFDPERLEEIRIRLVDIRGLVRKYGGTLEAVLEHRRRIGEAQAEAEHFDTALDTLTDRMATVQKRLSEAAVHLNALRKEVAHAIREAVEEECSKLGMVDCRFEVRFSADEDPDGWIHTGKRRVAVHASGMDRVEFYISTNKGEALRPLARVASGGEISRIMLALKTVLARSEAFPVLVFDEIDTGISGAVASKVGQSLHALAANHQIIAITHLPQIAAQGDAHFVVEKYVEGGRTKTRIRQLVENQRAEHVAGLMAGADITDAARQSAQDLMEASRKGGA